ncbi:DUF3168 domain-containing protein [Hyphomonas sp.]|uniref:DUF3168 domain-containing protein n=1 Tax=Hyphomonas sp. TaxID=87 RepID=UPI00391C8FDD
MSAESGVQAALIGVLKADAGVAAIFGPRIYDDETEAPAYPFVRVERHECRPAGSSLCEATEHVVTLAVSSRDGGVREAREALAALRTAVDLGVWSLPQGRIVLAHVTYGDAMRQADRRAFRGVIRIRIISEEAA